MKRTEKGFSVVEILIVVVVVGLIGGAGWYVWQSKHKTNKSSDVAQSTTSKETTKQTPASNEPVFNKLPTGWAEYKSNENGLRLGFPTEWGKLDPTTLHTPDYRDDTKNLQGRLTVAISKKEGFTVIARKYGATIKPSSDGKGWVVVEENPANVDNYKVGDTYKTKEQKVNGGTAIDLTFVDEECTQTRYLLELKNSYVVVSIPELCPVNFEPISASNKDAYNKVVSDFLSSITFY